MTIWDLQHYFTVICYHAIPIWFLLRLIFLLLKILRSVWNEIEILSELTNTMFVNLLLVWKDSSWSDTAMHEPNWTDPAVQPNPNSFGPVRDPWVDRRRVAKSCSDLRARTSRQDSERSSYERKSQSPRPARHRVIYFVETSSDTAWNANKVLTIPKNCLTCCLLTGLKYNYNVSL